MAAEQLQIEIKANVQDAVSNLKQVQAQLANTGKAAVSTSTALPKFSESTNRAAFALQNFGRVAADAPFGLIGIGNNIAPLLESFASLRASATATGTTIQASLLSAITGPAGLIVGVQLVTSALTFWQLSQQKANAEVKKGKEDLKGFADIQKEVAASYASEVVKVEALIELLRSETTSRIQKANALKELNKISPEYFGNLKQEEGFINKLNIAYAAYIKRIDLAIQAKTIEKQLTQINEQLLNKNTQNEVVKVLNKQLGIKTKQAAVDTKSFGLELQKGILLDRLVQIQQQLGVKIEETGNKTEVTTKKTKEFSLTLDQVGEKLPNLFITPNAELVVLNNNIETAINNLKALQKLQQGISKEGGSDGRQLSAKAALTIVGADDAKAEKNLDKIVQKFTEINDQAKFAADTINNGINQGIDTFFNALANNQDPFKALVQSVQRLVVELGAAVVKALVLKAITTAINPGVAAGGGLLKGLTGGGAVRGDMLRLVTFGR